ncbi:MAG TPA: hypothetical protein DDW76_24090 [Cyanobacteria bacterium UBA11369]|nr:hypothetical protein [Cyanobacteria bacterium UBA11371]HBE51769.1 hypothetical protein [Cyanobacteria bacterium UBA11369]
MNTQFAELIVTCCKLSELELRSYIKEVLASRNFSIQEDRYLSQRSGEFSSIHNLLALRGNPKVCLVSHTDVCRDHDKLQGIPPKRTAPDYIVNPAIKNLMHFDNWGAAIQDENCLAQVGGDDRVGVAIALWLAVTTDSPLGILLTTDEEIGLISAKQVDFPELMDFELLVQIDRGNQPHQEIVTEIFETKICEESLAKSLVDLSIKKGKPRQEVVGRGTDVFAIKSNGRCKNAINLTCGYHNSYGSSPSEYIVIHEAEETMEYVKDIIEFMQNEYEK